MLKRIDRWCVVVICLGLMIATGCANKPATTQPGAPAPAGSVAAAQTNIYQGVGVVKSLNPKRPGIEIDHEEIVGLMQAMQMEFPVTDGALLNGVAVNDRIDFTIDNAKGEMTVIAIKKK